MFQNPNGEPGFGTTAPETMPVCCEQQQHENASDRHYHQHRRRHRHHHHRNHQQEHGHHPGITCRKHSALPSTTVVSASQRPNPIRKHEPGRRLATPQDHERQTNQLSSLPRGVSLRRSSCRVLYRAASTAAAVLLFVTVTSPSCSMMPAAAESVAVALYVNARSTSASKQLPRAAADTTSTAPPRPPPPHHHSSAALLPWWET